MFKYLSNTQENINNYDQDFKNEENIPAEIKMN